MKSPLGICVLAFTLALAGSSDSCEDSTPTSTSGVQKTNVTVPTGPDGLTVEQRNVKDRLAMDNKPGSIKHLYVISAYSGQVILYSTVRGKVTSSGKRLSPYSVATNSPNTNARDGFPIYIGGEQFRTGEVLQDDGTYGDSVPYIYWWDVKGIYHQQYISGDMMVHISDQPIPVKSVTINLEVSEQKP